MSRVGRPLWGPKQSVDETTPKLPLTVCLPSKPRCLSVRCLPTGKLYSGAAIAQSAKSRRRRTSHRLRGENAEPRVRGDLCEKPRRHLNSTLCPMNEAPLDIKALLTSVEEVYLEETGWLDDCSPEELERTYTDFASRFRTWRARLAESLGPPSVTRERAARSG